MKTVWGLVPVIMKTTQTDKNTRENLKINVKFYQVKNFLNYPDHIIKIPNALYFPQQYAQFLQKDNYTILFKYVQINTTEIHKLKHVCVSHLPYNYFKKMRGNISLCLCL